jgi:hypothetical protein
MVENCNPHMGKKSEPASFHDDDDDDGFCVMLPLPA